MTFLEQARTTESFFQDKFKTKSRSTKVNTEKAILQFDRFCHSTYKKTKEQVFKELRNLDDKPKERHTYELLQKYINFMTDTLRPNTSRVYFSLFKKYLAYMIDAKIHSEDIQSNIELPKEIEEEPYPLTIDQIKQILQHASFERQALYLTLASSGMRIQESCKVRKRDFVLDHPRLMIKLSGAYTKTKRPRHVFLSREAGEHVKKILNKLKDDDLVFGTNADSVKALGNEQDAFKRIRDLCGFNERYESGTHKITIHSFRSFFITRGEKVHEGFAHCLAGHDRYMKRYERYSDQELLEAYLKIEPNLLIFESGLAKTQAVLEAKVEDLEARIKEAEKRKIESTHGIMMQIKDMEIMEKLKEEIIRELKWNLIIEPKLEKSQDLASGNALEKLKKSFSELKR